MSILNRIKARKAARDPVRGVGGRVARPGPVTITVIRPADWPTGQAPAPGAYADEGGGWRAVR